VVATQGKRDEAGLEAALSTGAGHVAFIASRRKAEKLREYLKERGYPAERVDAIESPAGIDIGALTEEEIAVSVLASAIRARRKTGVGVGVAASAPAPASTGPAAGEARDPVCGMTVDVATSEFYWDYLGTRYYFCCEGCRHAFQEEPERYLESALQL
jgi:xanthine dehydrogenase accessory factor